MGLKDRQLSTYYSVSVMKMISKILLTLFLLSSQVWAECDISKFNINYMRNVHDKFEDNPNLKNATMFFGSIPDRFCEFNKIYGYPGHKEGPLYRLDLHETLPKLESFIPTKKLVSKYIALASEAKWDADNVNALQDAYHDLFLKKPDLVIKEIMGLPETKRKKAITFIFDGPHPSNTILHGDEKNKICEINHQFCFELNQIEKELLKEEELSH